MELNEIKAKAREAVDEIYALMTRLDNCEALIPYLNVDSGYIITAYKDNDVLDISKALTAEQMDRALVFMQSMVIVNINDAGEKLMQMSGMVKEPPHEGNPKAEEVLEEAGNTSGADTAAGQTEEVCDEASCDEEDAAEDSDIVAEPEETASEIAENVSEPAENSNTIQEPSKKGKDQKKPAKSVKAEKESKTAEKEQEPKKRSGMMDVDEIIMMRDEKNMTYQEIAEYYGYKNHKTVTIFLKNHRISLERQKEEAKAPEVLPPNEKLNTAEVRKLYTDCKDQSITVGMVAKKLGVTKKELYQFIADNHLERPVF